MSTNKDRQIGAMFLRVVQARRITLQSLANKMGINSKQAVEYRLKKMQDKNWHSDDLEEWIRALNIQGETKAKIMEIYENNKRGI